MQKKSSKTNSVVKTAKAPEIKSEVKEVAKKVETVAETAAKKAEEKAETVAKTVTKTADDVKKTAKKTVEKKATAKKETAKTEFVLQFQSSEINLASLEDKVKAKFVAEGHRAGCIRSLNIYVKPEEYKAYYVINDGKFSGQVDLF